MNRTFLFLLAAVVLGSAAQSLVAAPAVEEAQAMIDKGQFDLALKRLDTQLKSTPQDADARFLRGLVLVRLSRNEEAIKAFADLSRDYPQLPEPYNNLAVIYAQKGDYAKARDALEAALATHPSYATAHENLGDVYAALAGAAYNRALVLDQSNQTVRNKLNLINQLGGGSLAPKALAATGTPPLAASTPRQAPLPAAVTAPAEEEPESAQTLAAETVSSLEGVLTNWANAWSEKNVGAYLTLYATDFVPEGGLSRDNWAVQRRDRITRPNKIKVKVSNPQFTALEGGRVRATFVQEYESDDFSDQVTKVLELREQAGWKIVREYTR